MLDRVDRQMVDWLGSIPGLPRPVLHPSASEAPDRGIGLHLLDLSSAPPQRNAHQSVWQFRLRYLVTANAPDAFEAHAMLGTILAAALGREGCEVVGEPPPIEIWHALGLKPQPSVLISVPLHHAVDAPTAEHVTRPLEIVRRDIVELAGRVVGPGDIGIMSARVEIPALALSTLTDGDGRFRFPATPAGDLLVLRVFAKGKVIERSSVAERDPVEELVVRVAV